MRNERSVTQISSKKTWGQLREGESADRLLLRITYHMASQQQLTNRKVDRRQAKTLSVRLVKAPHINAGVDRATRAIAERLAA